MALLRTGIVRGRFRWEGLGGLLPKRSVDPEVICSVVREHLGLLFAEMNADETLLVEDACSHRHVAVFGRFGP